MNDRSLLASSKDKRVNPAKQRLVALVTLGKASSI